MGDEGRKTDTRPAKPPRPKPPRFGTPEYAEAELRGDWQLLAWTAYPGETQAELDERGAENARLAAEAADARRKAERDAWHAEQVAKGRAKAGAT